MASRTLIHGALALTTLGLIVGCNTGSRKSAAQKGGGGTTFPPANATLQVGATVANAGSANLGDQFTALAFRLTNANAGLDVAITSMTFTASGTVDETTAITSASIVVDANGNGIVDAGEVVVQSIQTPFTANNGTVMFSQASPPVALPTQTFVDLLLVVQLAAPTGLTGDLAFVGQTVQLAIAAATDIAATTTSTTTTLGITGVPFTGTPVPLGIGTHLLISEAYARDGGGGGAEFIEIFNPTAGTIDLSNYHLADVTQQSATPTVFYFNLPTGDNYGPGAASAPTPAGNSTTTDFTVRFPQGATIGAGEFRIIAVDGANFGTQFAAVTPHFALRGAAGATQAMRVWDGVPGSLNFTAGDVSPNAGLTDGGEPLFLFTWNGQVGPDLISDVDIVGWGTNGGAAPPANPMIDKTTRGTDGPDADAVATNFLAETPVATQEANRAPQAPAIGQSLQRIAWNEGTETKTGGNGLGGHDETSEDWKVTFTNGTPTPGTP